MAYTAIIWQGLSCQLLLTCHQPANLSGPRISAATARQTAISGAPRPKTPMVVVAEDDRLSADREDAGVAKDVCVKAFCLLGGQGRAWGRRRMGNKGGDIYMVWTRVITFEAGTNKNSGYEYEST